MAKLTRKDYVHYVKLFGLSLLVTVPLLIVLDVLIVAHVNTVALMFLNVVLVIAGYIIANVISEKRKQHIAKKREEFLANQTQKKTSEVNLWRQKTHKTARP